MKYATKQYTGKSLTNIELRKVLTDDLFNSTTGYIRAGYDKAQAFDKACIESCASDSIKTDVEHQIKECY